MAKRRFVIHIGLPHAGGGSLAGALSDHAAALAEAALPYYERLHARRLTV